MVTRILRLPQPPQPADAADALALAICHLWRDGTAVAAADRGAAAVAAATPAQRRWLEAAEQARRTARRAACRAVPGG